MKHLVCFGTGFGTEAWRVSGRKADEARGIFTDVLLEGLEKAIDEKGEITASSLEDFVKPVVFKKSKALGLEQIPEFSGNSKGIVFARQLSRSAVSVSIEVPPDWTGYMVLRDGSLRQITEQRPVAASLKAQLVRGCYRLDNVGTDKKKQFFIEGTEPVSQNGELRV